MVGEREVEAREVTAADLAAGVHPRTSRLVRVALSRAERRAPSQVASDALRGLGSPEETIKWLEQVRLGEVTRMVNTSTGDKYEAEFSDVARVQAGKEAQRLREFLDERERNYVGRDLVADALVGLAGLLAARLAAVPARLADRVAGGASTADVRLSMSEAVDEIRMELGDEAERYLEALIG